MFVLSVPWSVWELGQSFEATERERGLTGTSLPSFPAQLTMPLIRGLGINIYRMPPLGSRPGVLGGAGGLEQAPPLPAHPPLTVSAMCLCTSYRRHHGAQGELRGLKVVALGSTPSPHYSSSTEE